MKAVVQRGFGGLEALSYEDVPEPEVGPHDVLVRTGAAALNHLDVLQRRGPAMLPGFSLPHIAGMDVAGTVVAVGKEVAARAVGDRVLVNPALGCGTCPRCRSGDDGLCGDVRVVGATRPGGYAELCVVPADHVHPLPPHVGFEEAATVPTTYSTAWHALVTVGRLQPGETLVVHGAGSGVTTAAVQLATRLGARVIATSRSDDKLDLARRLGADAVVNTAREDLASACRELDRGRGGRRGPGPRGAGALHPDPLRAAARGRLLFAGTTTGNRAEIDLPYAYHFGISILGVDPYAAAEFAEMLDFYWQGGFQPVVDSRFPLAGTPAAQARLESGASAGKILLVA